MPPSPSENRCQHTDRAGRRCRMPRVQAEASLCTLHAGREPGENPHLENLTAELLGPLQDFRSAAAINYTLGRLLILTASNRIPPRNATVVAYICQLLLQSISDVKHEVSLTTDNDEDNDQLQRVLEATSTLLFSNGSPKAGN